MAEKTTTVEDLVGNEHEVPVGVDGKNPVSPNNPSPKSLSPEDRDAAVEAAKQAAKDAVAIAKAADADAKTATNNKS